MKKRLPGILLAGLMGIQFTQPASAASLHRDAPSVFERSVTHDLQFSDKGGAIELEIGELFEDDGPASGHSYKKPQNQETVTSQTRWCAGLVNRR